MAILPVRTYPDPVLRARCAPVEEFDQELRRLVDDMIATTHAEPGIGLAASQVGVPLRVAVVDLSVGEDPDSLHVLVNPVLSDPKGTSVEMEGCLSLPDFSERVARPASIRVEAMDVNGRPFTLEAEEWLARAICHEVDHLDGVLFVDRLHGLRRDKARRYLKRLAREKERADWSVEASA